MANRLRAHALARTPSYEEEYEQGDDLDEKARLIAKQKQERRELDFEREMMLERERRIKQIEEDVLDVNEIMRELGTMVHDQGEVVGEVTLPFYSTTLKTVEAQFFAINLSIFAATIEDNIERVHTDVNMGRQQLEQASRYTSQRRRKLCWCASVAFIVALIIVGSIVIKFIDITPSPSPTPPPTTTTTTTTTTTKAIISLL